MLEKESKLNYASNKDLNIILKIVSLFIPIIGFIIYAAKKNTEPKAAKSACEMAIAGIFFGLSLKMFLYAYNNR